MRPTDLKFRSPKEKTAELNFPKLTNTGNILLETISVKNHPSFSKGKRFNQYESEAKKTGFRVGPGSYEHKYRALASGHIKGGHAYKLFYRNPDTSNNGYLFVGNHLMFDASFLIPSRKHKNQNITHTADLCDLGANGMGSRSTSSNTPVRKWKKSQNRMSPSYEDFNFTMKSR